MTSQFTSIQLLEPISEKLSNLSLGWDKSYSVLVQLMNFNFLKTLEKFNSLLMRSPNSLLLTAVEAAISLKPSSLQFLLGKAKGDDLQYMQ